MNKEQGAKERARGVPPMNVSNCNRLAKPHSIYAYFDLIQVWRREPLDHGTCSWLRKECRLHRENKPIVRILRLKPDASGHPRPGGCFEFAERHLRSVIGMLSELASILEASR